MVLPEVVKVIESSNECLYFAIKKGDFSFRDESISLVVASHYFIKNIPKFYVLFT